MKRQKRPFGITMIVVLRLVTPLGSNLVLFDIAQMQLRQEQTAYDVVSVSLGLLGLVIALGLWWLRRWAWVLIMLLTGVEMALDLIVFFNGDTPRYVAMVINVVIVFYLNQKSVQEVFARRRPRAQTPPPHVGEIAL